MADLALETRTGLLSHPKVPGVFLEHDGGVVLSPPEIVLAMAKVIARLDGKPELADELQAAFDRAEAERRERSRLERRREILLASGVTGGW